MMQKNLTDIPIINMDEKESEKENAKERPTLKWLEPSVVARVKFKEILDGHLVQPKLARIRLDKYPRECVLE
jgi:ATP-dependent DNA ligase